MGIKIAAVLILLTLQACIKCAVYANRFEYYNPTEAFDETKETAAPNYELSTKTISCSPIQVKTQTEIFQGLVDMQENNNYIYMQVIFAQTMDILGWNMRGKNGKLNNGTDIERRGIVTEYRTTYLSQHGFWQFVENKPSKKKEFVNNGNLAAPQTETVLRLHTPLRTLALRIYPQLWDGVPYIHMDIRYCRLAQQIHAPLKTSQLDNDGEPSYSNTIKTVSEDVTEFVNKVSTDNIDGAFENSIPMSSAPLELDIPNVEGNTLSSSSAPIERSITNVEGKNLSSSNAPIERNITNVQGSTLSSSSVPIERNRLTTEEETEKSDDSFFKNIFESLGGSNNTATPKTADATDMYASFHGNISTEETVHEHPGGEYHVDEQEEMVGNGKVPKRCFEAGRWRYSNISNLPNDRFASHSSSVDAWHVIYTLGITPFNFNNLDNSTGKQYLEIRFDVPTIVEKIKIRGHSDRTNWGGINEFVIMYQLQEGEWLPYKDTISESKAHQFTCDANSQYSVGKRTILSLQRPFIANSIRIIPERWSGIPYMALDFVTCPYISGVVTQICNTSLLTKDGRLLLLEFKNLGYVSSNPSKQFKVIRLSNKLPKRVAAIVVKVIGNDLIAKFSISYETENGQWLNAINGWGETKIFLSRELEQDINSPDNHMLPIMEPFVTKTIRLYPVLWRGQHPGLLINFLGCEPS